MNTTLYFTREFTKGILAGIRHNDSLPFTSIERAETWRKAINANKRLEYKIVDHAYQKYDRGSEAGR